MQKSFRAAIAGVIIGLICGTLYVEYGFMKKYLNEISDIEQAEDMTNEESSQDGTENLLTYTDEYLEQALIYYGLSDEALAYTEGVTDTLNAKKIQAEATSQNHDTIRIKISYEGEENLSDTEKEELEQYVMTNVLYAISEKLGKNYGDEEISEVRNKLIMSLEYINASAAESAEEWGVSASAKSTFDYLYMNETANKEETYPAGYYETLCISLQ